MKKPIVYGIVNGLILAAGLAIIRTEPVAGAVLFLFGVVCFAALWRKV